MARLRSVAYVARDADKLSRFCADHFGLSELGRSAADDVHRGEFRLYDPEGNGFDLSRHFVPS